MIRHLLIASALLHAVSVPGLAAEYLDGFVKSTLIDGQMVLTDSRGYVLYTYDRDTPFRSNCDTACGELRVPLYGGNTQPDDPDFTLIDRDDHTFMWAYKGQPLYLWTLDAPGETGNHGMHGVWRMALE
jgi:predicted lipoprotein with Yx(FWY)xxD motif